MTILAWLPDAAWRGALLLAVTLVLARLLRSQPAALRHVLWTAALAGVMAMPLLAFVAPVSVPVSLPQRLMGFSSRTVIDNRSPAPVIDVLEKDATTSAAVSSSAFTATDATPPAVNDPSWFERLTPVGLVAVIWLVGVALFAIRLLAGFVTLARMRRCGREAEDTVSELTDACAARLGMHDVPRVIVSPRVAMPCTAGWTAPVILLPDEYAAWTRERLEVVLLHELSHIRRMDIIPHVLSEIARVVYWFNPLVWVAAARLRAEAERATDDRVVHAGARPSDYAAHLLDIVRQSRPVWHPAPLMPLARRTEFEGRMLAILESGGALASPRWALGTVVLIAGLTLGVASVQGAPAVPPANEPLATHNEPTGVLPDEFRPQEAPDAAPIRRSSPEPLQSSERESTIGALAEALRDPVASVRQAAAEALGSVRDTVAVRALMEVLRTDESAMVRRSAAWSLGEIRSELAIPALADALARDRDTEVRKNAASALGRIDSPRATSVLTQALERDTEASVRVAAAEALANIEDPSSLDALIRALGRDDEPRVRRAVIEAIDNLEGARAVPAVSAALRDADAGVRRAAAEALGSMDDSDAVPPLMAAARDADVEVRRAVIHSLGNLDDRRALPAFVAALGDADADVRQAAADGIGNIDNLRSAPPELIRAMDDSNADVRHAVAHALGHIEDPAAIRVLVAHVTDPNVEVRQAVVESLDQFDDPAVTAALRTALKDTDAEVRQRAVQALGNRNRSK